MDGVFLFLPRKWSPDKLAPAAQASAVVHKFLGQPSRGSVYFYYRRLIAPSLPAPEMEEIRRWGGKGVLWGKECLGVGTALGRMKELGKVTTAASVELSACCQLCAKQATCLCH